MKREASDVGGCVALMIVASVFGVGCVAQETSSDLMVDEGRGSSSLTCPQGLSEAQRLDVCFHREEQSAEPLPVAPRPHQHYRVAPGTHTSLDVSAFDFLTLGIFSDQALQISFNQGERLSSTAFTETTVQEKPCRVYHSYFVAVRNDARGVSTLDLSYDGLEIASVMVEVVKDACSDNR